MRLPTISLIVALALMSGCMNNQKRDALVDSLGKLETASHTFDGYIAKARALLDSADELLAVIPLDDERRTKLLEQKQKAMADITKWQNKKAEADAAVSLLKADLASLDVGEEPDIGATLKALGHLAQASATVPGPHVPYAQMAAGVLAVLGTMFGTKKVADKAAEKKVVEAKQAGKEEAATKIVGTLEQFKDDNGNVDFAANGSKIAAAYGPEYGTLVNKARGKSAA